uniref:Integrase catalytic domain-containing protein n=1 Tax=Monopterus albus TaxID=43700 RepID=A0A3Q3K155_MONAL
MFGIQHKFGAVYHPASQGLVERANRSIKEGLAKVSSRTNTTAVQFDLCEVIDCGGRDQSWREYDAYLCLFPTGTPDWHTSSPSCHNPLLLTIQGMTQTPLSKGKNSFYLVLRVDVPGTDPKGLIKIKFMNAPIQTTSTPKSRSSPIDSASQRLLFHQEWFINHSQSRADLWWICGDMKLRPKLPRYWTGQCALIQLVMPFKMFPAGDLSKLDQLIKDHPWHREKRSTTLGGVPDEFKARNQIGAGFESFLAWWVTINVDWINYIYYNQQRFINYTRDAVKGIAEHLGPTSLMAWQNRMSLDMLLAKEGGVCKMIGIHCCTFIPNNTAPDGSITKALEGLTALSVELAENSGINDPFSDLWSHWFGKWSGLVMSGLVSVALFAAILVLCSCCCIPCIRQLCTKCITRAIDSKYSTPPPYQLSQLASESAPLASFPQLFIYKDTLDLEDKEDTRH